MESWARRQGHTDRVRAPRIQSLRRPLATRLPTTDYMLIVCIGLGSAPHRLPHLVLLRDAAR